MICCSVFAPSWDAAASGIAAAKATDAIDSIAFIAYSLGCQQWPAGVA